MRPGRCLIALLLLLCLPFGRLAVAQPPPEFCLEQNDPNPFCGETEIRFCIPLQSHARLEIRTPDNGATLRVLLEGPVMAGFYSVLWDGTNAGGAPVPDGDYPYMLTVTDGPGGPLLFEETRIASLRCPTTLSPSTWGALKFLRFEHR